MEDQTHLMYLERTHPSGAEEWYCPTCGRRFLMKWPPAYEIIIIEKGDPYAQHNGVKGIGSLQAPGLTEAKTDSQEISEASLRPWIKAIEQLDLNW